MFPTIQNNDVIAWARKNYKHFRHSSGQFEAVLIYANKTYIGMGTLVKLKGSKVHIITAAHLFRKKPTWYTFERLCEPGRTYGISRVQNIDGADLTQCQIANDGAVAISSDYSTDLSVYVQNQAKRLSPKIRPHLILSGDRIEFRKTAVVKDWTCYVLESDVKSGMSGMAAMDTTGNIYVLSGQIENQNLSFWTKSYPK